MAGLVHDTHARPRTLPKRMTSAEYWELPEDAPRCELIHGRVYRVPGPDQWRQEVSGDLFSLIREYLRSRNLGKVYAAPFGLTLPDDTELQPDLLVLGADHPQLHGRNKSITHPPLLVVEILCPSTRAHDERRKFGLYESFGVPHYWIADPEARSIETWSMLDGGYQRSGGATAPTKAGFPPFADLVLDLEAIMPRS